MKSISIPHNLITTLEKDFKGEVVASEMVEQGVPDDRILILPLGAMARSFRKDVNSIDEELSDYDHKEYFIVRTTREGIYDMLPEGVFHYPTAHRSAKTEKEVIATMKQRRAEEHTARKFFLPFETTVNYLRMQMALYENRLDKRSHYDDLVRIFTDRWEIFKYLDSRQANIFLYLIPIIYDIRDNYRIVEKVLEMMFLLPVSLELRQQLPQHTAEPSYSLLGECGLGVDLTTGNSIFDDGVDEILIRIGPIANKGLHEFMEGQANQKILELLCDYLLPVHLDIVTELELETKDRSTRLQGVVHRYNSDLGVNTYL